MTVVFSAVLNNVTAMIIVGSLTAVSLEKLGRRDKLLGFLLIEGLLTNIGGLLTLISSVPNIIVGNDGRDQLRHLLRQVSSPYVVVATAVIAPGHGRQVSSGSGSSQTDEEKARGCAAARR